MIEQTPATQQTETEAPEVAIPAPRSGRSYDLYLEEVITAGWGCLDAPLG